MADELELVDIESQSVFSICPPGLLAGRSVNAQVPIYDLSCSRRQFQITIEEECCVLEPLSQTVPTLCDGQVVREPTRLREGMVIRAGKSCYRVRRRWRSPAAAEPPTRQPAGNGRRPRVSAARDHAPSVEGGGCTIVVSNPLDGESCAFPFRKAIPVDGATILGRDPQADVTLEHVQVSRRHARVQRRPNGAVIIQDLGSANGTFVDGRRIALPELLKPHSRVKVGPFLFTFTGDALTPVSQSDHLQLEARNLTVRVPAGLILDDVSLVIRPKEFACVVGPTGSGKSTLLNALSARKPASSGSVLLNGSDLYENFESLKQEIAVVSQHDVLHELLTLKQALWYTAKMRLPADTSDREITDHVEELLKAVGLTERRETQIRKLSGGQRRRASLANEMISNPGLLFLDEVTSGLDEMTDREMMRLFRAVADSGKTVVCVTHTLANIEEMCDLVVFLTVGGKLAFVGTPSEAREYFGIDQLGHVYGQLAAREQADAMSGKFQQSAGHRRYVSQRVSGALVPAEEAGTPLAREYWRNHLATWIRQLPLLAKRYWRVFSQDRRALVGMAAQCLVVAVILYLVFGDVIRDADEPYRQAPHCCSVLFVLAVSCFWFGCNNSAKEIVKEREIYRKELQANLDPGSYFASKFALQIVVAMLQSLVLLAIVSPLCELPGSTLPQALILLLSAVAGVATGLFLSAVSSTEEMALALVPLVLIPQIILSGIFLGLDGFARLLGRMFVTNYWIFGLMRGTLPDRLVEQLNPPLSQPLPAVTAALAVALHITVLSLLSVFILHVRDRIMASSNKTLYQAIREITLFRILVDLAWRS